MVRRGKQRPELDWVIKHMQHSSIPYLLRPKLPRILKGKPRRDEEQNPSLQREASSVTKKFNIIQFMASVPARICCHISQCHSKRITEQTAIVFTYKPVQENIHLSRYRRTLPSNTKEEWHFQECAKYVSENLTKRKCVTKRRTPE